MGVTWLVFLGFLEIAKPFDQYLEILPASLYITPLAKVEIEYQAF